MSTGVTPMLAPRQVVLPSTRVIANSSSPRTTWSPASRCANSVAVTAAMPDAETTQSSAPSSVATFSSSARLVGLPVRE